MKYILRNCTVEAEKLEYTTEVQKEIVDWVNAIAAQHSELSLIHACAGHDGGVVIKYPDGDRVVANTGAYVVHDDCGISVWEGKHFEDTYMLHEAFEKGATA